MEQVVQILHYKYCLGCHVILTQRQNTEMYVCQHNAQCTHNRTAVLALELTEHPGTNI